MIISTWVAVSVVVFSTGPTAVLKSDNTFDTQAACEIVQERVMKIAAKEVEILAIGTKCIQVNVSDEIPGRSKIPSSKEPKPAELGG